MVITEEAILHKTHYGLNIYAHILRKFYPSDVVLSLSGRECKPTRNPFNDGSETLLLKNPDTLFVYSDSANPDFKGNPFDFATQYYKLTGIELLKKLNEEMHLRIDEGNNFYKNRNQSFVTQNANTPKFSFYKRPISNIVPFKNVDILEMYELIKADSYNANTQTLQSISNKLEARYFKSQNFDYVTISGTFTKRNDNSLIKHSGLLTIDFDHLDNCNKLKEKLLNDDYFETELLFTSPSGDGLKWIIPIEIAEESHLMFFKGIENYIKKTYKLEIDKSGKDISRACFLPHDANIYINPKYLIA